MEQYRIIFDGGFSPKNHVGSGRYQIDHWLVQQWSVLCQERIDLGTMLNIQQCDLLTLKAALVKLRTIVENLDKIDLVILGDGSSVIYGLRGQGQQHNPQLNLMYLAIRADLQSCNVKFQWQPRSETRKVLGI